ncbi:MULTISPECIES: mycofactocin precursor MftA [unclassified Streptomyces]
MINESQPSTPADTTPTAAASPSPAEGDELIEQDLLVEEVSIDGMCGVY